MFTGLVLVCAATTPVALNCVTYKSIEFYNTFEECVASFDEVRAAAEASNVVFVEGRCIGWHFEPNT